MKRYLLQQLKWIAIALAMVPLSWAIVFLYFIYIVNTSPGGSSNRGLGHYVFLSMMFGTIPGLFVAGAAYTIVGWLLPEHRPQRKRRTARNR